MPHISIRGFSVWYGKQAAVRNITLDIPDQQITAFIGPSGCGKTTLLRSLNRLIDLTEEARVEGEIRLDGANIFNGKTDIIHLRKQVGLLSQKPQPLPMSIYDNVAYGLRLHGLCKRWELDQRVQHYLELSSLWEEVKGRLREPASKLSVGQQQRLCLARALAVEPEVLLCDEPTAALDPLSAQRVEQRLKELKKDYTIVLVTHTLRQARRVADYVAFLFLGELIEHGPAAQFFEQPQHERTRAYLSGEIS